MDKYAEPTAEELAARAEPDLESNPPRRRRGGHWVH